MAPLWEGLVAGRCGLDRVTRFDPSAFRCRVAGEVRDYSAKDFVPKSYRKATKVMARDTELAVGAAKLAVDDAGLVTRAGVNDGQGAETTYPAGRLGCQIGAGLIAAETDELSMALATARDNSIEDEAVKRMGGFDYRAWGTVEPAAGVGGRGPKGAIGNLQPLWMLKYLPNMLACHVTIIHGCEGPSNTITCAEASGLLSIGESARVIERGDADACLAGGAESKVNLMGMMRVDLAGRLAETPDGADAAGFVRPFDPESPGSVAGEGGGIVVLEALETAKARGAKPYAEIVGFGAGHSSPPMIPPLDGPIGTGRGGSGRAGEAGDDNDGLTYAIEAALADAGIGAGEIDAVVPQAVGVPNLDAAELGSLKKTLGARLAEIPLITLAPAIGDCFAGNGGLQLAAAAMSLREQRAPARIHGGRPAARVLAGQAASEPRAMRNILVCSSSLGGQNAAVVVRRMDS